MNGVSPTQAAPPSEPRSVAPRYLDAFIFGEENRQARSVIDLVAESPGVYNPLVLFGPPGVGKTHLLLALASEFTRRDPQAKIVHLSAGDLPGDYNDDDDFRLAKLKQHHRGADLLILENLHQLAGRMNAQQDVLLLIDAVLDRGNQVAVSLPAQALPLDDFSPRLVSRLSGGLAVPVRLPSLASRVDLLARLAAQHNIPLEESARQRLASELCGTALELHGALQTLSARSKGGANGRSIGNHDVAGLLTERPPTDGVTLARIASTVARYFAVTVADLRSASRRAGVVLARGTAINLARELTDRSLADVGKFFGGRDHTTALYNVRQVKKRSNTDPAFARAVSELRERLRPKESRQERST